MGDYLRVLLNGQAIVVFHRLLCEDRHSGLDPESSSFNWIPAGVYPVLDTGRE